MDKGELDQNKRDETTMGANVDIQKHWATL